MKRIRCNHCNTRIRGRKKVKGHIQRNWVCRALQVLHEVREQAEQRPKLILEPSDLSAAAD